jgi:hypothetical protein
VFQVRVCVRADNSIILLRGNDPFPVTLATSAAGVISPSSYNYIEVDAQISTNAQIVVNVNGTQVINVSGVNDVDPGSNAFANGWQLKGYGNVISRHDDVYILPDPGGTPMGGAFLGSPKIYAEVPFANSTPLQWTPLSPPNWSEVDEIPPDGDTSYNSSGNIGDQDQYLYRISDVPVNAAIAFVQHVLDMKTDSGARTVASDFAGNIGPGFVLSSGAYVMYTTPRGSNPNTGSGWQAADFPAKFGPKVTA